LVRDALDVIGASVAFLIGAALVVVMVGGATVSREACVDRETGQVSRGSWAIDPLAWFGATSVSRDEICESETGWQFVAGKIPLVGDGFERTLGGPQNLAYYEGSDAEFDRRLVREVGAGSVALKGHDNFYTHAMSLQRVYGPAEDRTMGRLLRGDVFKVSAADLSALSAATDESETAFERELDRLRRVVRELRTAEVSEERFEEFGDDTQEFLEAWNGLLVASADDLDSMAEHLESGRPLFAQTDELVTAAQRAHASGSMTHYEPVRRETLRSALSFAKSLRGLGGSSTAEAEDRVADAYNDSTDSQVLVSVVNEDYPDGYLPDRVGRREGL
jgi:hypothetical protein